MVKIGERIVAFAPEKLQAVEPSLQKPSNKKEKLSKKKASTLPSSTKKRPKKRSTKYSKLANAPIRLRKLFEQVCPPSTPCGTASIMYPMVHRALWTLSLTRALTPGGFMAGI